MYSAGADVVDQSLKVETINSGYLDKTFSSDGNRRTFTWSFWVKRANTEQYSSTIVNAGADNNAVFRISINYNTGKFGVYDYIYPGGMQWTLETNARFRDFSAWYHVVVAYDSTQSTNTDRCKIYINGVDQIGEYTNDYYPGVNYDSHCNTSEKHMIGATHSLDGNFQGYLAEVHFLDGVRKLAVDFGETGDYGEWKPIEYSGTYGTNGFYLDFADSGNLGDDESGNGNDFAVNGITADDQMLDTPTNNFPVLNPNCCHQDMSISEGFTKLTGDASGGTYGCAATMSIPSTGKWYWEVYVENLDSNRPNHYYGVDETEVLTHRTVNKLGSGHLSTTYCYQSNGNGTRNSGSESAYGAAWSDNDIIGVALDMDNGTLKYYRNNTAESSGANAFTGLGSKNLVPTFALYRDGANVAPNTCIVNFGQDSSFAGNQTSQGNQDGNDIGDFYYTPPTDYLALCTSNLPTPAVVPSEHFDTVIYSGSSSSITINDVGFQPDMLWAKKRSGGEAHALVDAVRGVAPRLETNNNNAAESGGITSFDSDGFTVSGGSGRFSENGHTYVGWMWKANGSGSANTDGDIDSTISANTDAKFSIVTYTGVGGEPKTVAHGLGVSPEFIIIKKTNSSANWAVWHKDLADNYAFEGLNNTGAAVSGGSPISKYVDAVSSTLVSLGDAGENNQDNDVYVMYCWAGVEGYSKAGSYDGNSNADGTFVYTGFRPAYVMVKRVNTTDSWLIQDNKRETYNEMDDTLAANSSGAEDADTGGMPIDFLSNGIKMRGSGGDFNVSEYIYIAFAETPFKYATAR
jgi:hypothetical protein